jgi:hypothetical protein
MPTFDRMTSLAGLSYSLSLVMILVVSCLGVGRSSLTAAEPLIERGAKGWRYCESPAVDGETWQTEGWTAVEFDDSAWPEGKAILGYGDPDVTTELSFGIHPQRKESSALFRRRFRAARDGRFRLLRGRVCCDDGAVVYVNGQEVFRNNLPPGKITPATHALRAVGPALEDERRYHPFAVSHEVLVEGTNLVAVSVHQANGTSSDLAMDLELTGLTSEQEANELQEEIKRQAELDGQAIEANVQVEPVVRFDLSGD